MPVLMPTPEEMQRIPHHKKVRMRRAILNILCATDEVVLRHASMAHSAIALGERIRAHARELEATITWDPPHVIQARRDAWLQASP